MKEENIQKVRYSLAVRRNPLDENEPKKAYANVQLMGTGASSSCPATSRRSCMNRKTIRLSGTK